jgi:hypothetical protein|tara:strand:+ start:20 stop:295 length:276 start_codon:yes stop_codon:yes gene_type:complete
MKKVAISIFMLIYLNYYSQDISYDSIYVEKDIEAVRRNISTMKFWLNQDYADGNIPLWIYDQYYLVLNNSEMSLKLLLQKENVKTRFKINK